MTNSAPINLELNAKRNTIVQNAYESLDFDSHGWIVCEKIHWECVGHFSPEENTIDFIGITYAEPTLSDDGDDDDNSTSAKISVHVTLNADTDELVAAQAYNCNSGSVAATFSLHATPSIA